MAITQGVQGRLCVAHSIWKNRKYNLSLKKPIYSTVTIESTLKTNSQASRVEISLKYLAIG